MSAKGKGNSPKLDCRLNKHLAGPVLNKYRAVIRPCSLLAYGGLSHVKGISVADV